MLGTLDADETSVHQPAGHVLEAAHRLDQADRGRQLAVRSMHRSSGRTPRRTDSSDRRRTRAASGAGRGTRPADGLHAELSLGFADGAREDVHRRAPDEAGHERVGRHVPDRLGRVQLLEHAVLEHGDPLTHRHRLDLVVGDVEDGDAELAVQIDELRPHLDPKLCVEVGQGLVHQEDLWPAHQGPGQGDTLALATRERRRLAAQVRGELEALGHPGDDVADLVTWHPARAEGELDVLAHAQVGVEGIALEDHGDVAILGDDTVHRGTADPDGARRRRLEPGDEPQHGRLATARRPQQHEELSRPGVERDLVERSHVPEGLGHALQLDRGGFDAGHGEDRRAAAAAPPPGVPGRVPREGIVTAGGLPA